MFFVVWADAQLVACLFCLYCYVEFSVKTSCENFCVKTAALKDLNCVHVEQM